MGRPLLVIVHVNVRSFAVLRDGVPARAIVVVPRTASLLPTSDDGITEPASVEIHY
jgi:hypothetical protein